ncbi:MAG: lysophospholipid acyltransferase family protein [Actinobacteria bacterium]|nr:lysophospholipid acyltransferase family protein [Actinomycetota bacterium]
MLPCLRSRSRVRNHTSDHGRAARTEWWKVFLELANRGLISYWVIRFTGWLAWVLPIKVSYGIGLGVAFLIYHMWGAMRQVWTDNIRQVVGVGEEVDEKALRRIVRSAYSNYFRFLVDWLRLPRLPVDQLDRSVRSVGWEHLDEALQAGKGVIFVGFHLGNWEMAPGVLAGRGYPINVVVESFKPPKLNELIQSVRTTKGVSIIPLENSATKIIRALRRNEILALLIDRPSPGDGVPVRFCGEQTAVPAGAAQLALRTGAKIVTGAIVRQADNTILGTIAPAVVPEPTGDFAQDVEQLTQRIIDGIEEWVRQYPDQWYMFRRTCTSTAATASGAG